MEQSRASSGWENPPAAEIERIINNSKIIAVVGLSSKESRASHRVARYLQEQGFEIIPVNPRETEVLGEKAYPDLASIGRVVDIVDIFRKGEDTPPIVEEAIRCKTGCIWLQEDVISQESFDAAGKADVPIVMDTCLLKEHMRLRS